MDEIPKTKPMNQVDFHQGAREVSIWDHDNPRSLIRLTPPVLSKAIEALPLDMVATSPKEHRKRYMTINQTDEELRQAFWDEYFVSCDSGKTMRGEAIYGRVMSREYFYSHVVHIPEHLSFMIKPPADYMYRMRCLLEMGIERFYDILKLPLSEYTATNKGRLLRKTNTKLISEIIKIMVLVDNRVKGAVPIRNISESKTLHVNLNHNVKEPPKSYADVERELAKVEQELKQLSQNSRLATFVDVNTDEVPELEYREETGAEET